MARFWPLLDLLHHAALSSPELVEVMEVREQQLLEELDRKDRQAAR